MNAPRAFSNLDSIKKAVKEVVKEGNIPTVTFPSNVEPEPQVLANTTATTVTPLRKPRPNKSARAPNVRTSVDVPDYVPKAIAKMALDEECTKRFLWLKALRAIGITINDIDFEQDGRRENQ
jgi:hypothetical protein